MCRTHHICSWNWDIHKGHERIKRESDDDLPFWSFEARKHISHGSNIHKHHWCMCMNSLRVWCYKHRTWRNNFFSTTSAHGQDDLDDVWRCAFSYHHHRPLHRPCHHLVRISGAYGNHILSICNQCSKCMFFFLGLTHWRNGNEDNILTYTRN